MSVPIIIISYNNYLYVDNTIKQIKKLNPWSPIIIIDNNSNDVDTTDYLAHLKDILVIRNEYNRGPWVDKINNTMIYDLMPDKFVLTDPDLEYNPKLPNNFVDILSQLSDELKCEKIGFAISLSDRDEMYQQKSYMNNGSIYDWESQFWNNRIEHKTYELYQAPIDTTFCLINKKYFPMQNTNCVRVAGNFTCRHLPFYLENKVLTMYDKYKYGLDCPISTISHLEIPYIQQNYLILKKNTETLLIKKDPNDPNLPFWENVFQGWEPSTFSCFDKYLSRDKIFIDIGGWIGTTCIYGSRKSKHVYVIEADVASLMSLRANCSTNCHNVTIIDKVIYNVDDQDIVFGKNRFLENSKINDSTSQIIPNKSHPNENETIMKTITLKSVMNQYKIDPYNISLIKVDIEGGEEYILDDLLEYNIKYKVPLYISFHVGWWNDQNVSRFSQLKNNIYSINNDKFITILFPGDQK